MPAAGARAPGAIAVAVRSPRHTSDPAAGQSLSFCRSGVTMSTTIDHLITPHWAPLRNIEQGWAELTEDERAVVAERLEHTLRQPWHVAHQRDALGHFFAFLAQVETIAIEVPLRFLPAA